MSKLGNRQKWSSQFRNTFQEIEVNPLEEGATALMYACQQENVDQLRSILNKKPGTVRDRDRTLKTVLHYCAENKTLQCAEIVLHAAPELLDAADEDGYTVLHLAVIAGNTSMVNFLISKSADINKLDSERHSVIHWATVCREVELLEMLLKSGANPSTPDMHGGYSVHYAAQMCGSKSELGNDCQLGLSVLKVLITYHVNVSVMDHDGRQPLLWAASAGSSEACLELINAGASVQAYDKDGLTALHCAASRGHTECLETLVELCAADIDAIDTNGCTALFYSVTLGHADATQLLLGYGANPNRQDRKGRTPAHCGAAKGQLETLKILNKRGANLWMRNNKGDYPLQEAVNSGRKELVLWLLSQRPETVNASNLDGRCPLHIAAINNNIEMCKIILDHQSLINPVMRSSKGDLMTPLDAALYRSNRGCAKYLQLHGGVPACKLTSSAAALRGPHRVESHSDHHIVTDTKIDGRPVSSRCSRSLNTSPYSINRKVQVHITADVSSETLENRNSGEAMPESSTKKYKKKMTKIIGSTEKFDDENIGSNKRPRNSKRKEDLHVTNNEAYSDETDYIECSTESEHKQRRRFRKKRTSETRTRNKSKTHRTLRHRCIIQNHSSDDSDGSDSPDKICKEVNNNVKKTGNISDEENYMRKKNPKQNDIKHDMREEKQKKNSTEHVMRKEKMKENRIDDVTQKENSKESSTEHTVIVEVHKENDARENENTDSNGFDTIQYQKLETDTDTAWEAHFDAVTSCKGDDKQNEQLPIESENNKSMRRSENESKEINESGQKRTNDKIKADQMEIKVHSGSKEVTWKDDAENLDAFGQEPFSNQALDTKDTNLLTIQQEKVAFEVETDIPKIANSEIKNNGTVVECDLGKNIEEVSKVTSKSHIEPADVAENNNTRFSEVELEDVKRNGFDETDVVHDLDKNTNEISKVEPEDIVETAGAPAIKKTRFAKDTFAEAKKECLDVRKLEHDLDENKNEISRTPKDNKMSNHEDTDEITKTDKENGEAINDTIRNTIKKPENRLQNLNMKQDEEETKSATVESENNCGGNIQQSVRRNSESKNDNNRVRRESNVILNKSKSDVEQKGLICVLPDYDGNEESGPEDFYSEKEELKLREKLKNSNRHRSRSSFEILSDCENERSSSQLDIQEDSGFEPSPRHSNVPSEGSCTRSSRSRIPRAKHRFVSYSKNAEREVEQEVDINVTSVTQAVQTSLRTYHLERRIFNTLLELKRLQIRAGKANEQVSVKRLIDDYQKAGLIVGLQQYDGVYSFKHFEKYLYNQLRLLQCSNRKLIPRIKSSDDLDRLTKALRRTKAGKTLLENVPDNPLFCTHGTHRCIHATHAYTGIPCAAYIAKMNHHEFPKGHKNEYRCFLPRIDLKPNYGKQRSKSIDASKSLSNVDPSKPVTLELIHGAEKQTISLPTEKLDKNKRYYVTFTIKGNSDTKHEQCDTLSESKNTTNNKCDSRNTKSL